MKSNLKPKRMPGFDYRQPYFYMVTIKRLYGVWDKFSEVDGDGYRQNDYTRKCVNVIRTLHNHLPEIGEITTFTVMPDHLHLLIRIIAQNSPRDLTGIVNELLKRLGDVGIMLDPDFHDYIVDARGDLKQFTRYIRENPNRAVRRKQASDKGWFNSIRIVDFADARWYAYGNTELLQLPVIVQFRGSRTIRRGSSEWNDLLDKASRIGPAGAGVSTFMNDLEKECAHRIALGDGNLIILSPRGFPPAGDGKGYETPQGEPTRWHPPRRHEPFFAKGKILYLSLWPGTPYTLSNSEICHRCHLMWNALPN